MISQWRSTLYLLASVICFACADHEELIADNYFSVGDKKYPIAQSQLVYNSLADTDSTTQLVLIFISEGMSFIQPDSNNISVSGKGDAMLFYLNAPDSLISRGEQYIHGTSGELFGFEGEYYLNWHVQEEQQDYYAQLADGILKVLKQNNTYTLKYEGTDEFDEDVHLNYSGELLYFIYE